MAKIIEESITTAFAIVGKKYKYKRLYSPAAYITEHGLQGVGVVNWIINAKPPWFVVGGTFIAPEGYPYDKKLLLHLDKGKTVLDRCHSFYMSAEDYSKGGGNMAAYSDMELIAAFLDHIEKNTEETCTSCKGEHPYQKRYIQMWQPLDVEE